VERAQAGRARLSPRVSIVIPVHQEGEAVEPVLRRLLESVTLDAEILVVHDEPDDSTLPTLRRLAAGAPAVRAVHNTSGRGPARAIASASARPGPPSSS